MSAGRSRLDARLPRFARLALAASCSAAFVACAATEERPRTEDDARRLAPLPACLVQLPSKGAKTEGVVKSLSEEQIWRLVYPSFDPAFGAADDSGRHSLPADPVACTGRAVLRDEELEGGAPKPVIKEGDVSLGGGGDRLKVAWLRSMTFDDGTEGGALALVRSFAGTAEVYAVGAFRGRPKTLFSLERVGPEVLVVAEDQGCAGRKAGTACETPISVYVPRFGALDRAARFAEERVAYAEGTEPGVPGRVEYRLSSAAQYVPGGIRVLEQVLVRDELGREIRKAELERDYTFAPDGTLVVSEDSLWSRVVASAAPQKKKP
jgi:hypothetical protein